MSIIPRRIDIIQGTEVDLSRIQAAGAPGQAIASAAQQIGQGIAEYKIAEKQTEEATWLSEQRSAVEMKTQEDFESFKIARATNPKGASVDFREGVKKYFDDTAKTAPTTDAANTWRNLGNQFQSKVYGQALEWESGQKLQNFTKSLEKTQDNLALTAYRLNSEQELTDLYTQADAATIAGRMLVPQNKVDELNRSIKTSILKNYALGQITRSPAAASALFDSEEFGKDLLTGEDVSKFKDLASSSFVKQQERAKVDELMNVARNNEGVWDMFVENKLDLGQIQAMEDSGQLDENAANHFRTSILKDKLANRSLEERADRYTQLYDQISDLKIRTKDGKVRGSGSLNDYIGFQNRVLEAYNDGYITRTEATGFIKKISVPLMDAVADPDAGVGFFEKLAPGVQDPYQDGYDVVNAYMKRIGRKDDLVAKKQILQEIVTAADDPTFQAMTGSEKEKQFTDMARRAINAQAKRENPELSALPFSPETLIDATGFKKTVLPGNKDLKADATLTPSFRVQRDAEGNYAKVFADGTYEEIGEDEANLLLMKGAQ